MCRDRSTPNSRHVAQALTRVQAYARLCNDAIQLSLETGRRGATLVYEPQGIALTPASPGLRSLFEMGTATFVRQLRSALQDELAPTEVRFATSPPADPSVLEGIRTLDVNLGKVTLTLRSSALRGLDGAERCSSEHDSGVKWGRGVRCRIGDGQRAIAADDRRMSFVGQSIPMLRRGSTWCSWCVVGEIAESSTGFAISRPVSGTMCV